MSGRCKGNVIAVYNGDPAERHETVAHAANMAQSVQEGGNTLQRGGPEGMRSCWKCLKPAGC